MDFLTKTDKLLQIDCHVLERLEQCADFITDTNHKFKILTFNIRSIQRNFDEFCVVLGRLRLRFDVIILTECWISEGMLVPLINGYNHYCTSKFINRSGGVIAYIRSSWNATVSEPLIDDCNCLEINLSSDIAIVGIYRSPSFQLTDRFVSTLAPVIKRLSTKNVLILTGDINLDIYKTPLSDQCSEYVCLLTEYHLLPAISKPTRGNACLDHIFVKGDISGIGLVAHTDVTDHNLCMLGLPSINPKMRSDKRMKTVTDYNAVAAFLTNLNWSSVSDTDDVNIAASNLMNILNNAIISNTKTISIPLSKFIIKPWITPGLIKCQKNRDRLHIQAKKNPSNLIFQVTYKRYRNFLSNLVKKLRVDYESGQLTNNLKNPKNLWQTIKNICNFPRSGNDASALVGSGNPLDSLNSCNEYFTNIGKKLADHTLTKLNVTEDFLASNFKSINTPVESLFLYPTDVMEVGHLIKELKNGSAPGLDGCTSLLLKSIASSISEPLVQLFNLSLASGTFPDVWKTGVVSPIHKEGSKSTPSNYRPISLLSIISKLLEKIVNKRVVQFLESNSLISNNQFGFRCNRSTEDAVVLLTRLVADSLDRGRRCLGAFIDLAKAFDTVSIPILLRKLYNMGIRGIAHVWFLSYLTNRRQCVRVGSTTSDPLPVTFGVPQGSILGPTLFLIYINDIINISLHGADIICYADDTAVLFHDDSWEGVSAAAELGMSKLAHWLSSNLLTLNLNKTKFLTFHKTLASRPLTPCKLTIHSCSSYLVDHHSRAVCGCPPVEHSDHIKYLGVIIDEKFSFKKHISLLSARVRKSIFLMKSLRQSAPVNVLLLVYKTVCQSSLLYCLSAWGGIVKTALLELEIAQRAVLRVMLQKPYRSPTNDLYKETKVLRVRQLFILKVVTAIHKRTIASDQFPKLLARRIYKLPLPAVRTFFARRLPPFIHIHTYNRVCRVITTIKQLTVRQAKHAIDTWLRGLDYSQTEKVLDLDYR